MCCFRENFGAVGCSGNIFFYFSKKCERCYVTKTLHLMFDDPANKLYLTFLSRYLKDVTRVNELFQSSKADPSYVMDDLCNLYRSSFLRDIVVPGDIEKIPKKKNVRLCI